MKKICLVFSTGRCGTAFLSQVFSGKEWNRDNKAVLHNVNDVVVSHERGFDIAKTISELKKYEFYSTDSIFIQQQFINNMIREVEIEHPTFHTFFTSHMSIGRYISHCLDTFDDIDYRVLYVKRDMNEVVESYNDRLSGGSKIGRSWDIILNNPFEPSTITKINPKDWNSMDFKKQLEWFWTETKSQWSRVSHRLHKDKTMSINFNDMFNKDHLFEIADFFDIPVYDEFINNAVNIRDKSK